MGEKQKKKPSVGREERAWYQASRVAEGLLAPEVEIDSLGCVSREKGAQLLLAECLGHWLGNGTRLGPRFRALGLGAVRAGVGGGSRILGSASLLFHPRQLTAMLWKSYAN